MLPAARWSPVSAAGAVGVVTSLGVTVGQLLVLLFTTGGNVDSVCGNEARSVALG